jgi:hypothetical protein
MAQKAQKTEPTEVQKNREGGFNGSKRRSMKAKAFFSVRFELHFFVLFVPMADVAKGADGAKSAFCGYSCLQAAVIATSSVMISPSSHTNAIPPSKRTEPESW